MDAQGQITYRSPSYAHVLGYTPEEVAQMAPYQEVYPEDISKLKAMVNDLMSRPGASATGFWRQKHKNGQWLWIEGSGINLLHDPSVRAIVNNFRDVTAQKKALQEIAALNHSLEKKVNDRTNELQQANKLLESYNYSVAHDLRSPMRIMAGYAKVLSDTAGERLNEHDRQLLDVIISTAKKSAQLVTDLLDFSQVSQKKIDVRPVNLDSLLSEIIFHVKETDAVPLAIIKVQHLGIAICDEGLIKQVWINLISNAVKYSKKNPQPQVEIGTETMNDQTVYFVKDNGIGFENEHAEKLFDVFYRVNRDRTFEGTGIGLALVKSVIEHHGGKIWAEGQPGIGAIFRFYLPLRP